MFDRYSRYWHGFRPYQPVTAYTVTQPVIVEGDNLTEGPYPPLNFQPQGEAYPFIYVPIATFTKVGASVTWNPDNQTLNVKAGDYNKLKQKYDLLQKGARALYKSYQYESRGRNPSKWRYYGDCVFDGYPYQGNCEGFTVGNFYNVRADGTAGTIYYFVTNDNGEEKMFTVSSQEKSMMTSQYT